MRQVLFNIGPISVYGYGLMIALGVIAAYMTAEYRGKKLGTDTHHLFSLAMWSLLGGFLGAKVLYWLTDIPAIIANPSILLNLSDGFVVYGGIIGGVATGFLLCKKKKLPFAENIDLVIPSVALAQGFGRIGCFLAGCCYGAETHSVFGVVFPDGSLAPTGISLIPTQLFASGLNFLLFGALIIYAKRRHKTGQVAALYLILYSAGRFVLEFLRGDAARGFIGVLSTSQLIAIVVFCVGCGVFVFQQISKPKRV